MNSLLLSAKGRNIPMSVYAFQKVEHYRGGVGAPVRKGARWGAEVLQLPLVWLRLLSKRKRRQTVGSCRRSYSVSLPYHFLCIGLEGWGPRRLKVFC